MATKVQLPLPEYLSTSFEGPDRQFVEGEIIERAMPDVKHSRTQWLLGGVFYEIRKKFPLSGHSELRLRIGPERIRIVDFCVFFPDEPAEQIPSTPPYVTVEIVSPDDRYSELLQKLDEYWTWGVKHVWLADPSTRKLSAYDSAGLHEVTAFSLPEFELHITPTDLF
jgi:Uma2 family endonuclease